MKKFLVIFDRYKDKEGKNSNNLIKNILDMFFPCTVDIIDSSNQHTDKEYDLIFTVGGDGTILKASHISNNVPIVGINLGRVGFMAAVEPDEIVEYLDRIKNGNYKIKTHSFLESNLDNKRHIAVNDIIIGKSNMLKTISISLSIDNIFVDNYICDGLLISSAFGSTAYNMSLNGPIVHPDSPVLIITPIAPIGLKTVPYIVPDSCKICVEVHSHSIDEYEGILGFDGANDSLNIKGDTFIEITKSKKMFSLIEFENYYNNLHNKLLCSRRV